MKHPHPSLLLPPSTKGLGAGIFICFRLLGHPCQRRGGERRLGAGRCSHSLDHPWPRGRFNLGLMSPTLARIPAGAAAPEAQVDQPLAGAALLTPPLMLHPAEAGPEEDWHAPPSPAKLPRLHGARAVPIARRAGGVSRGSRARVSWRPGTRGCRGSDLGRRAWRSRREEPRATAAPAPRPSPSKGGRGCPTPGARGKGRRSASHDVTHRLCDPWGVR